MNSLAFEEVIGYEFNNKELLLRALTHSSFLPQGTNRPMNNNERLEFLGDAFLDAIVSVKLCERMRDVPEGVLTKTRAKVVCEKSLAEVGRRLNIGEYMRMSGGEEHSGGRNRTSIVADAMEAVIGAIFQDGGYEAASDFVLKVMDEHINLAVQGKLITDFKTEVQEMVPPGHMGLLKYQVVREEGPDHDKVFYVDLTYDGGRIGSGIGKSKKEAEMKAAKEAVERGDWLEL